MLFLLASVIDGSALSLKRPLLALSTKTTVLGIEPDVPAKLLL